jgi:hypothetical protein
MTPWKLKSSRASDLLQAPVTNRCFLTEEPITDAKDLIMSNTIAISNSDSLSCSRREFLKKSSLAGMLLSFSGLGLASANSLLSPPLPPAFMGSGFNIYSFALIDDCARLAMHSDKVSPVLKKSLPFDFNVGKPGSNKPYPGSTARLASIMPFSREDYVSLLANAREKKNALDDFGDDRQKLAFALGWVMSHAGNKHLGQFKKNADQPFSESDLYLDAAILRDKSAGQAATAKAEDLESLFKQMTPRVLTRFHTFIPDMADGPGWVLRIAEWRENLNQYYTNLAAAYAKPDAAKMKQYVTGPGVYSPADEVIKLARSLQRNKTGGTGNVEQATSAKAKSHYARAVAEGYRHLKTASDFFEGKITEKQLMASLS